MHHAAETIALFCRLNMNTRRALPMRASDLGMLLFVAQADAPQTPLSLARRFQVSKPMVTAAVHRLTAGDYLGRYASDADRRSYCLALTDKGRALVDWCLEAYCESARLLSDAFGEEAFGAFLSQLAFANGVLSESLQRRRPDAAIPFPQHIHIKEEETMFGSAQGKIDKLVEKQNAAGLVKYLGSKDEATRVMAIKALGQVPSEEAFNNLTALVRDPSAVVRAAAAYALSVLGNPKARAFIEHASAVETDATVKTAISEALNKLHDAN